MCCSLGLSKSAEIICLCEQKIKENQEFNCANPGKSPPISNKDNLILKPWADTGNKSSAQGQDILRLAKQSGKGGREQPCMEGKKALSLWLGHADEQVWLWEGTVNKWLNLMASTRNAGLENYNNSTSNMKNYAWHPKLHAVILRFMIWTAMWKTFMFTIVLRRLVFFCRLPIKKIPYILNWKI